MDFFPSISEQHISLNVCAFCSRSVLSTIFYSFASLIPELLSMYQNSKKYQFCSKFSFQ